jgi:NAD(P)-dependent dehydrogenase (short-subunit alcohol dehydrogenase family)
MLLTHKIAVIYGAGGAIGTAVAHAFAREGASLYLAGRTAAKLEAVAKGIKVAGGKAAWAQVDALDEAAVTAHVHAIAAEAGAIDILFNAIGMEDIQGTPLVDMSFDDFFKPISKAARSQFLTAQAVGRHMAGNGSGVMLTVTAGPPEAVRDIGGFGPACQMIEGLWRGLAAELAPSGVRVICLRSAGSPDSPDFQEMVRQHTEVSGETREQFLASLASGSLLKRLPMTAEVADIAAMMASDRASALTGTFINVTCGAPVDL